MTPMPPCDRSIPAARAVGAPVANPTAATRRLYAGDWGHFVAWCREHHRVPLPASADTFAAYLLAVAPALSRGALGRRRAAIGTLHRQAGQPVPLLDRRTHKALRTHARSRSTTPAAPLTAASLVRMATLCPRDLAGLRDRALFLLAAIFVRPERPRGRHQGSGPSPAAGEIVPRLVLLALDAEDVRFTPAGAELLLRTRTDEVVPGRTVALPRAAAAACPVRALEDWLRTSETAFGPVFRKVDRWGNVEHGRLGPDAWHRIVARRTGSPGRRRAPAKHDG